MDKKLWKILVGKDTFYKQWIREDDFKNHKWYKSTSLLFFCNDNVLCVNLNMSCSSESLWKN